MWTRTSSVAHPSKLPKLFLCVFIASSWLECTVEALSETVASSPSASFHHEHQCRACNTGGMHRWSVQEIADRWKSCGIGATTLHLRGGKLHPSLYPWLLSGHTKVDYYSSLGVSSDATPEEIRLAYKALVLSHHPDRKRQGGGEEGGGEENDRFIAVREAWEVLGDEESRRAYDLYVLEEEEREIAREQAWANGAPGPTDSGQGQASQSVSASFSFGNKNRYGFF